MNTTVVKKSNNEDNKINILFDETGPLSVRFRGGKIVVSGKEVQLEETILNVKVVDAKRVFLVYLMTNKKTKEVEVVVDEVGPTDIPLDMSTDPTHAYLFQIASLIVPEKAKDLSEASMTVYTTMCPDIIKETPAPSQEN